MAPAGRRRAAKRRSNRQHLLKTVTPGVGLLAMLAAAVAVVAQSPATTAASADPDASTESVLSVSTAEPPAAVSRSAERPPLPNEAEADARIAAFKYASKDLKIHADSDGKSPVLARLKYGDAVAVTGKKAGGWTQIMHNDAPRWVKSSGVVSEEPLGSQPCPFGSEKGLQPDSVKAIRAVCAKFPQITRIGTIAGRGEHATGHSLDIMTSDKALGDEISAYLQDHRSELGIEYLIWRQRIWRPSTSGAWRGMGDRGSATANHMDHVHVTVFGDAATD